MSNLIGRLEILLRMGLGLWLARLLRKLAL